MWIWGSVAALVVVVIVAVAVSLVRRRSTHFDPSRLDKVTRGEIDQSVVATGKVQALVYDSQKNAFVDVPDGRAKNGLRRVAVKAGIANGSRTEILSGLSEGQTVYLQP
jgi:hypothetical protein